MSNNYYIECRICSTTHEHADISDSSCFTKFFMQLMSLKEFKRQLWLCKWCKAAVQKAIDVITVAIKARKGQHKPATYYSDSNPLIALDYYHDTHIDIPPAADFTEEPTYTTLETVTQRPITPEVIENNNIPENNNKTTENNEEISELEQRDRKKLYNFDAMMFNIIYLTIEEQKKEIEELKVKYKDFEYQCVHCGMGFLKSDAFVEHKIRHSEFTGKYECPICGVRFRSAEVIAQHSLQHRRRFSCQLCAAQFKRWSRCIAHRCTCGAIVDHIACSNCAKVFPDEHKLKIHMKVHSREKYGCEHCSKNFSSKQHLTVHLRTHSGVRPFVCVPCGRSFNTGSNLRKHRAVHSKISPHYCVECHTYYKTAKALSRHLNESSRHADKNVMESFPCPNCSKHFTTEKSMKYHILSKHGEEHFCTYCKKKFATKSNLNKHVKLIHSTRKTTSK
ncbi:unnamed protein product [Chrysodeixis includens]|uniref:C2H2-type domain-containing protein n=1 Tax=Chrysodeixis includens TaxID=689277 RepID=A0A9N8L162_CHRIL|nr:unnamed protein product [Chrysodeixis includens]